MPAVISRNPLSRRAREKEIPVVLDKDQPDLGTVRLTLCEMPSGQLIDLKEDGNATTEELHAIAEDIAKAEASLAAKLSTETDPIAATRHHQEHTQRIKEHREQRKVANRQLHLLKMQAIQWGVAGHRAEDFQDEEGQPFPHSSEEQEFDEVKYKVTSKATLSSYLSLGKAFIDALYQAVFAWQGGKVTDPVKVWESAAQVRAIGDRIRLKRWEELINPLAASSQVAPTDATTKSPDLSAPPSSSTSTGT